MDNSTQTKTEINTLIAGFENRTLPASEWTHQAHIITCAWYLYHFNKWEATCYLRSGIIAYNIATGGKNTPEGGYHETITLFWIEWISQYLHHFKGDYSIEEVCSQLIDSPYAAVDVPFRYYSKEHLMSIEARARWVKSDLQSLIFPKNLQVLFP